MKCVARIHRLRASPRALPRYRRDAEAGHAMLTLAVETIDERRGLCPEQDMTRAFAEWPRVQAVREDLHALHRG